MGPTLTGGACLAPAFAAVILSKPVDHKRVILSELEDHMRVILSELEDLFGESKDLSGRDAIFCVSAYHGYISMPVSVNVGILVASLLRMTCVRAKE